MRSHGAGFSSKIMLVNHKRLWVMNFGLNANFKAPLINESFIFGNKASSET